MKMKLIIAIVNNDDVKNVTHQLSSAGFYATKLSTSGGFLDEGNTTLLIGAEEEKVERIISLIEEYANKRKQIVPANLYGEFDGFTAFPVEVTVGGATVFVLDVEQFKKL